MAAARKALGGEHMGSNRVMELSTRWQKPGVVTEILVDSKRFPKVQKTMVSTNPVDSLGTIRSLIAPGRYKFSDPLAAHRDHRFVSHVHFTNGLAWIYRMPYNFLPSYNAHLLKKKKKLKGAVDFQKKIHPKSAQTGASSVPSVLVSCGC